MWLHHYFRRIRIWETNFGRKAGWIIEHEGKPVALLTEPRYEDMFWESYRLQVVAADPELRQRLQTKEFWAGNGWNGFVWRSREFGIVAKYAFPSLSQFPEPGRLMMRGLYLPIGWPWPWDWIVLWLRRLWRKIHAEWTCPGERIRE